jgi:ATP-dependent RNA helicase DeaD
LALLQGKRTFPAKTIGAIDIYDKFTFVDVPERDARAVLRAMDGNTIKGKPVQIDIAK